jgi:hypothetical protein
MILFNYYELGFIGPIVFIIIGAAVITSFIVNRNQYKTVIVPIISAILIIPGIYMLVFEIVHPIYLTRQIPDILSEIAERNDRENIMPKGNGAIKYDVLTKKYSIEFIPLIKIAKRADDIRFIVIVDRQLSKTGLIYSDGSSALQWIYKVTILDLKNTEEEYVKYFHGENSPKFKIGPFGRSGKPPEYYELRNWIYDIITKST